MRRNKTIYIIFTSFLLTACAFAQDVDSLTIKYNYINSVPQNAKVFFNDNFAGETPFRFAAEQVDTSKQLTITLKLEGYLDYSFNVTSSDFPLNKSVTLIPVNKLTLSDKTVEENKSSYFKTPRKVVPIVITSVISAGSGVLSFYYKKLANDRYDEYLATGNKDKFDETKKYDLYSGIFLALFQIGLAGLLYFLLID